MGADRWKYDPLEGLTIYEELNLGWENQGDLKGENFKPYKTIHKDEYQAAGLYAFVLNSDQKSKILYIGKAGDLKPKTFDRWVRGIFSRAMDHWKSGPFRGLVMKARCNIHLWTIDFRKQIGNIGERDIERIENELLAFFLREKGKLPPGNTTIEGGKGRHFQVRFQVSPDQPLPRIILQPGESKDNRRKREQ
jgi:hypothetical protein